MSPCDAWEMTPLEWRAIIDAHSEVTKPPPTGLTDEQRKAAHEAVLRAKAEEAEEASASDQSSEA